MIIHDYLFIICFFIIIIIIINYYCDHLLSIYLSIYLYIYLCVYLFLSFSFTFWRSLMFSISVFFPSLLGEQIGLVNDMAVSSSCTVSFFCHNYVVIGVGDFMSQFETPKAWW
jgi:hypothetical protein